MEEALESNFSKSIHGLANKSERYKTTDNKAKREITKIEELFQVHDKLLLETVVPLCENFHTSWIEIFVRLKTLMLAGSCQSPRNI